MMLTEDELKKIAELAYIEMDAQSTEQLTNDVGAIMQFVEKLRQVDTSHVEPLLHPLHLNQRLRTDEVQEQNAVNALEKMAPLFADNLYLVPKLGPFSNEDK
jgi:aspartyl-tRNA(Asn)/glutamyl-tRNA(Gln) amidotransferase subunit C